jgi:two-component system cell cycle response regulator
MAETRDHVQRVRAEYRMRVLLAHPHAAERGRLARALQTAGHYVSEAGAAGSALVRARAEHPDVAIIHAELAGTLVCDIKSDAHAYGAAILVVTRPVLDPATVAADARRGVLDYLVEPVTDGELLARVEAAGRTKQLQQELMAQGLRLEALLREDALTGLLNRRAILTQLAGMVSGARRHGHPLSIAILDLDEFKAINDEHGHHVGDDVLVTAVRAMRGHLRAEDQLGRLGGEEFLVLLPDTDADAASSVADKLRAEVAAAPATVAVTVSAGVATWADEAPEQLLRRADDALYRAKDAGRDRVMAATLHGRT